MFSNCHSLWGAVLSTAVLVATHAFIPTTSASAAAADNAGGAPVLPAPATRKIDFIKDIQPLLAERCYECHSAKKQEAGLRWDLKSEALKGGESGPPFIAGKSAESLIVHLVAGFPAERKMPRKGDPLSAEQIGLLRAWIDQGANWPETADGDKSPTGRAHWSFVAPKRPALSATANTKWRRNGIDAFVLARLEKEKLKPAPEADRVTLIRRLSLDLTGLPPSLEEIDAFLADRSNGAYRRVVERLLNSAHYGERWGRLWLDAARYADTNGYEKDVPRTIWPYRDWVIDAFNRDLPFTDFTVHQLAGDLLPQPTLEQRVATGFLRNSMLNEEGGVDPEQFRVESIVDRVDAVGKAFLGLTLACAQCHNHKYDPISQREYYQFFAFLNNDDEPEIEVPSRAQIEKRQAILDKIQQLDQQLLASDLAIRPRLVTWLKSVAAAAGEWNVLAPSNWFGSIGVKLEKLKDESLIALAHNPGESSYTIKVRTTLTNITGFRLETLTDPNLPRQGPGRAKNGNFVLQEFLVFAAPLTDPQKTNRIQLQHATADFSQPGFSVSNAIDGVLTNGWAIDAGPGRINQDRKAVFESKEPFGYAEGTELTFVLWQKSGGANTLGRFRLAASTSPTPLAADPVPAAVRRIMARPDQDWSTNEWQMVFAHFRSTDPASAEANREIDSLMKDWPIGPPTLALLNRTEHPRTTYLLKRGDFRKLGAAVSADVPEVLPRLSPGDPANRLGLARWIVATNNPLTARVLVNRVWQAYFGHGLVTTPEDFGTQGERPTHPELLDWLATEFMAQGWSLKALHRLIVDSATYRQSSRAPESAYRSDPYNRWLARGARFRLEAESIRDLGLATSGLLSRKIGGPSVFPPIPDGVLNLGFGSPMKWETSTGPDRYRRGLYTFWKRTVPYPSLVVFDAPNADSACVRRARSNTPLQALTTLNDAAFHEAAQALALRIWKSGGPSDRARADYAFRLCTGRKPEKLEANTIVKLVADQLQYFESRTAAALFVSAPTLTSPPADVNLHQVAAWTMAARVLLNLDETVTRE